MPIKNLEIHKTVTIYNKDLVNIYDCKINENTTIGPFVEIQEDVEIGKRCNISSHSFICAGITIGNNVFIGHNVVFINDRYPTSINEKDKLKINSEWTKERTYIKESSSIGSGSIIMCGVTIEKKVVVGAGSLVLKDIENGKSFYNIRNKYLKKNK